MAVLKFFKYDFLITLAALVVAFLYGGGAALTTAAILIVLEIVFSFDNAGVNAKYLEKLSPAWRKIFLTVGILIAVLGMRLLFPFAIVCIFGEIGPIDAWNLAMEKGDPSVEGTYGYILQHAHPMIASFGGMFLLMLFLNFLFDEEKDSHGSAGLRSPWPRRGTSTPWPSSSPVSPWWESPRCSPPSMNATPFYYAASPVSSPM